MGPCPFCTFLVQDAAGQTTSDPGPWACQPEEFHQAGSSVHKKLQMSLQKLDLHQKVEVQLYFTKMKIAEISPFNMSFSESMSNCISLGYCIYPMFKTNIHLMWLIAYPPRRFTQTNHHLSNAKIGSGFMLHVSLQKQHFSTIDIYDIY